MQRVVWFGIGSLAVSATVLMTMNCASHDAPPRVAVIAPVIQAAPVIPPAPVAPAKPDLAAMLKVLGERLQHELDAAYPPLVVPEAWSDRNADNFADGKIFALGNCERPTDIERASIAKRVRAVTSRYAQLSIGCKERDGIVVDATYDTGSERLEGHWKILRVTPTKIATLDSMSGESEQYWMEWSTEQQVFTLALVDVDGDGIKDVVTARTEHEGGSSTTYYVLELRRSTDHKMVELGTLDGLAELDFARGSTSTLVLRTTAGEWNDDHQEQQFLCITSTSLAACPASLEAARVDHAVEIATWFATAHAYEPAGASLPDRDLLSQLLDVVRVIGTERATLLAAAAETPDSYRIEREIKDKLAAKKLEKDTRAEQLMAALGDTECTRCEYKVLTTEKPTNEGELVRTDRFVYQGKALATVIVRGPATECSACGTAPPGQGFDLKTYRHGAQTIALVYRAPVGAEITTLASTLADQSLSVFVDGTRIDTRTTESPWFSFDGVETSLAAGPAGPLHWPALSDSARHWLAAETARVDARTRLEAFDLTKWSDPPYQAQVKSDRILVGI
ncbi:MAG TPA: hypothetical protein VGM39_22285 [Kofleriaceae bacterium]|jgi:hypothetical protein